MILQTSKWWNVLPMFFQAFHSAETDFYHTILYLVKRTILYLIKSGQCNKEDFFEIVDLY